jgi:hypothetical protein
LLINPIFEADLLFDFFDGAHGALVKAIAAGGAGVLVSDHAGIALDG